MEITVKVEIFDDPEYCIGHDMCDYYPYGAQLCQLFKQALYYETTVRRHGYAVEKFKKCPQCKAAYQAEKEKVVEYGCFFDDRSTPFNNCLIEEKDDNCTRARPEMKKEDCEYWRPVK